MYTIEEGILNALVCPAPNLKKNWRYVTLEINSSIVVQIFLKFVLLLKTLGKLQHVVCYSLITPIRRNNWSYENLGLQLETKLRVLRCISNDSVYEGLGKSL